jgi:hypothetical protein
MDIYLMRNNLLWTTILNISTAYELENIDKIQLIEIFQNNKRNMINKLLN